MKKPFFYAFSLPLVVFVSFFFCPLLKLIFDGLSLGTEGWTEGVWSKVYFTLLMAALSATLALVIGFVFAVTASENEFFWKRHLHRLSLVCFSLPTILVAFAMVAFWGPGGWVERFIGLHLEFYGWVGILTAHTFLNFPLAYRQIYLALKEDARSEERAALSLGMNRVRCFVEITCRKNLSAFCGAWCLIFLYSALSFAIILTLGGSPRFTNLEVGIYQAIKVDFDLALAVRLALLQLVISLITYSAFLSTSPRLRYFVDRQGFLPLYSLSGGKAAVVKLLAFVFALIFVVGPLLTIFVESLRRMGGIVWIDLAISITQSAGVALFCGVLTLTWAVSLAYVDKSGSKGVSRAIKVWTSIPLAISSLVLSLSLLRFYPGLVMAVRGNLFAIAFIQSLVALPIAFRPIQDGFGRISVEAERMAAGLGAGPWRRLWLVDLPHLRNHLLLSFLFAVTFSLGELGIALIFLSDSLHLLPLELYRSFGRYQFNEAYSIAIVLMLVIWLASFIVEKLER